MNEDQPTVQGEDATASQPAVAAITMPSVAEATAATYAQMLREIRSWGLWLLALGAIHLVASGFLSSPWGILLLVVGLASFYFREAAMFVIYGVTLSWAAISNLLSGEVTWLFFALIQLFFAFQTFRQFLRFRRTQAEAAILGEEALGSSLMPERAARVFPWTGCILGALALVGVVAFIVWVVILFGFMEAAALPDFADWLIGLVVNVGVLGLAVSLASLLSGHRYKPLAILGIVASSLVLLAWLALLVMTLLG
ncbi:MAG: hypothetical protein FJZ89_04670 [Chloroflexi bacterium]|nr:hypothetical protein [Chloroflexota bacterium]